MQDPTSQNMILWFFLACFLASILLMGWLLSPFFSIIVLGGVITGVSYPLYRKLASHAKIGPGVASLVTCLLILLTLFVPIVFFVGILAQEANELIQLARGPALSSFIHAHFTNSALLDHINPLLANFDIVITGEELNRTLSDIGRVVGLFLYDQARAIATNTLTFVASFFLMLLVVYFLLIDGPRLVRFLVDLSPLPEEQNSQLVGKFKDIAGAILVGNGLCGLIQGVAGGLVLLALRSAFGYFVGCDYGPAGLFADHRHRGGLLAHGGFPLFERAYRRQHPFPGFLPAAVRPCRVPPKTQNGGKTGTDPYPGGFFVDYRRPSIVRYSWDHLRPSDSHRFFDLDRYLPCQLPEINRARPTLTGPVAVGEPGVHLLTTGQG
jgi:hypothetical protein